MKGHLDIPKGEVEVKSPPNRKLILTLSIQIYKKTHFLKGTLFNEASDP